MEKLENTSKASRPTKEAQDKLKHLQYNEEPVHYCKQCLSLAVKTVAEYDFCNVCGSTEIEKTNIFIWETKYENKYGIKFINDKKTK